MTSLLGQWLRPCAPNAGGTGSVLGQRTGSHMPQLKGPEHTTKIIGLVCPSEDPHSIIFFLRSYGENGLINSDKFNI